MTTAKKFDIKVSGRKVFINGDLVGRIEGQRYYSKGQYERNDFRFVRTGSMSTLGTCLRGFAYLKCCKEYMANGGAWDLGLVSNLEQFEQCQMHMLHNEHGSQKLGSDDAIQFITEMIEKMQACGEDGYYMTFAKELQEKNAAARDQWLKDEAYNQKLLAQIEAEAQAEVDAHNAAIKADQEQAAAIEEKYIAKIDAKVNSMFDHFRTKVETLQVSDILQSLTDGGKFYAKYIDDKGGDALRLAIAYLVYNKLTNGLYDSADDFLVSEGDAIEGLDLDAFDAIIEQICADQDSTEQTPQEQAQDHSTYMITATSKIASGAISTKTSILSAGDFANLTGTEIEQCIKDIMAANQIDHIKLTKYTSDSTCSIAFGTMPALPEPPKPPHYGDTFTPFNGGDPIIVGKPHPYTGMIVEWPACRGTEQYQLSYMGKLLDNAPEVDIKPLKKQIDRLRKGDRIEIMCGGKIMRGTYTACKHQWHGSWLNMSKVEVVAGKNMRFKNNIPLSSITNFKVLTK